MKKKIISLLKWVIIEAATEFNQIFASIRIINDLLDCICDDMYAGAYLFDITKPFDTCKWWNSLQ